MGLISRVRKHYTLGLPSTAVDAVDLEVTTQALSPSASLLALGRL